MKTIKKKIYLHKNKIENFSFSNYSTYFKDDSLLIKYYDFENNWGDTVNPYLIEKITGKKTVSSNVIYNVLKKDELLGIGSIIVGDLSNYVIWGSGIMWENVTLLNKPKETLALRGLKTLKKIQEVGGNCDVFGDPVLLFPEIFPGTSIEKKYKYGIVPHFKDKNKIGVQKIIGLNNPEIKIIDIQNGIEEFVIDVLSCENILSSSLHGLILAEAYGIPTCRLIFSEEMRGGDFKFFDYYSGVGIKEMETVLIHDDISNLNTIFAKCSLKDLNFNQKALKNSLIEYANRSK
ncbi:MAG: polysaccharide pyruvyl transferase family protein [Bacteroidota bacterium]